MKKILLSIIGVVMICLISGCGRNEPHEYKDIVKYLNKLSVEAYQPEKSKWYNLDLNLKDKITLKSEDDNKWTFYINDYPDLEFSVSSTFVKDEIWGGEGYVLTDNYKMKSAKYFYNKFVDEHNYTNNSIISKCDFDFNSEPSKYFVCLYDNENELKEQVQFMSEFLKYLSNLDLKVYFNSFDFKNDDKTKRVYIGVYDKKLIPMYADGSSYRRYNDFVNELLKEIER